MKGKFSSILSATYPKGYDPDQPTQYAELEDQDDAAVDQPQAETQEQGVSAERSADDDFDLGDDSDDEAVDDEGLKDRPDEETASVHATGNDDNSDLASRASGRKSQQEDALDADSIYDGSQKRTVFTFSHLQVRDCLVKEGDPETRTKERLSINVDVHRAEIDIVKHCLQMLRAASERGKNAFDI